MLTKRMDEHGISGSRMKTTGWRSALFACAGTAALALGADAKTLAWYRFDEAETGTKPDAGKYTILNAVDPASFPAAAWTEPSGWSKDPTLPPSTDATWLATYADAFPADAKVFDPLSGTLLDNARCLEFKATGSQWGDWYGTFLTIQDDARLHVPSVTVEMFVRYDGAADLPLERTLLVYPNDNGNVWCLKVAAAGAPRLQVSYLKDGVETSSSGNFFGDRSIKDGKWHHLALVVDGTAAKLSLYQDYRLVKTEWLGGPLAYGTSGKALSIGHSVGSSWGAWPGLIDEVRISDAPLAPTQFLRPNTGWANCHPETVVYVPFGRMPFFGSDSLDSTVLLNQAVPTPFATVNGVTLAGAGFASLSNEAVAANVRRDLLSTTAVTNETALFTTVCASDRDLCPHLVIDDVVDATHTALTNSFTFEIFGKFEIPSGKGESQTAYLFHGSTGEGSVLVTVTKKGQDPEGYVVLQPGWQPICSAPLCDGDWHHVAVTYEKATQTFSLFVDYRLVGSKAGVAFGASSDQYPLQVLNGYGEWQSGLHGLSDGFRLTARALTPQEFLSGQAAADADYAAWIDFEDDTCVKPYPDVTPDGQVAAADGGMAPTRTKRTPGRFLLAADGTPGRANTGSLELTGGTVTYGRNLMIERLANQTVEFFLRGTAADAGAGILRLADETGAAVWAVETAANGAVCVRVGATEQTFAVPLADGAWHHWALTFAAADDSSATVTLWRDGAKVGTFAAASPGRAVTSSALMVGGGAAAFTGHIDEIRITPRVLDAGAFLRCHREGLTLMIR